ncbi:sensor histidine kinase [Arsenicibacter rosenii]|uniref:histidine kinase n=1 Tax=Arsenicibacter rosenii TaxID=1750698 RepID=A0A1S2V9Z2_9BACT|nr:ATP-binding protein [Arsenicibacter rosenii]OIN55557.1 PAS domain-containing sensor histidine kinase [Arsenicibacter rosenii]
MTLKSKISLGMGFLFVIVTLLGGLGAYYLNQLANDAKEILKDNYISLEYVNSMQKALLAGQPSDLDDFDKTLKRQEANITEAGEQQATESLRRAFDNFRTNAGDLNNLKRVQQSLIQLDDINRQAMFRKNETAEATAKNALVWLTVVGAVCFLIVFSFTINFPGYVANPLVELTNSIRQITSRNFEERLYFKSDDEFGELARSFNNMAQKLDEYEHSNLAKVLFEKRRIDTLIQIMTDGIIGFDERRSVVFVNKVAVQLLGIPESRLIGQYAPDVALHNDLLRSLLQAGAGQAQEAAMLKIFDPESGKENYYTKHIQPVKVLRTGEEQPVDAGFVIVLKNITPYKELDLAKTNFIATVSHELKTPISGIKMSLKLLDDNRVGALNPDQHALVGHIREDADRLLAITGELLNLAQAESGQIQLRVQSVPPADLISVARNAISVAAAQKKIAIRTTVDQGVPQVAADPDKVSWVLINLLSNAIRHSPEESGIDVGLQVEGNVVRFTVRDYGTGIKPEYRNRIFERYFQAPNQEGKQGGTGLGLAISKEFIEAMHGQIDVDKQIENGALFYFTLPVAA